MDDNKLLHSLSAEKFNSISTQLRQGGLMNSVRVNNEILSQITNTVNLPPKLEFTSYSKLQLEEQQSLKKSIEEYQDSSLCILQSIEKNTANLNTIIDLIHKGTDQQDEIIGIMADILAIAKSKDMEEAQTTYKKVMCKITETIADAESLAKVTGYASTVFALVQPIIEKFN